MKQFDFVDLMVTVVPDLSTSSGPEACGYCTQCTTCTGCTSGTSCTSCTGCTRTSWYAPDRETECEYSAEVNDALAELAGV